MKEIITLVKGYIDDLAHLMMSFVAIGAVSEVIFEAVSSALMLLVT